MPSDLLPKQEKDLFSMLNAAGVDSALAVARPWGPTLREFPGSPVIRTSRFHCRGHEFDPSQRAKIQQV